jgi:hypothetical protein
VIKYQDPFACSYAVSRDGSRWCGIKRFPFHSSVLPLLVVSSFYDARLKVGPQSDRIDPKLWPQPHRPQLSTTSTIVVLPIPSPQHDLVILPPLTLHLTSSSLSLLGLSGIGITPGPPLFLRPSSVELSKLNSNGCFALLPTDCLAAAATAGLCCP